MGKYAEILAQIAQNKQIQMTGSEIGRAVGLGRDAVRLAMRSLCSQGLAVKDGSGDAILYSADPRNPAVPLFKAFTTVQALQPLVKRLRSMTHRIVLYGPCADGTDTPADPINLFIVAPNPQRVLAITEPYRYPVFGSDGISQGRRRLQPASEAPDSAVGARHAVPSAPTGRKISAIIMPPGDEIPILTEDPETTIREIESGIVLWHDPQKPMPNLVTKGGGRNKIAITTNWLRWKRSADPGRGNEPYDISMAFDSHTLRGEKLEPFFNALPFPNVVAGDTLPMIGEGHFFYGPRDPGSFVALSVFWMEKDAGARDLGQTISDLQKNKAVTKSLKVITELAGEGLARLMPGLKAISTIVAEALKLNKDDEIFRTDGVYLRSSDPPFKIGSEAVLGNVFMDFNLKVISLS